jgi:hypothetical protein
MATTAAAAALQGGRTQICLVIVSHIANSVGDDVAVQLLQEVVQQAEVAAAEGLVVGLFRAWRTDRAPKHELLQMQRDAQQLLVVVAVEHSQLQAAAAALPGLQACVQAADQLPTGGLCHSCWQQWGRQGPWWQQQVEKGLAQTAGGEGVVQSEG